MPDGLVLKAVKNQRSASSEGMLQRLFAHWFDSFVYNQIWEDPRVDSAALEIDGDSRILTISSGGCNALNYLLESPASVTAADLNRHHIYLLNLKAAAARYLPEHSQFFEFFGEGQGSGTGPNYLRYIRKHLDRPTRDFWESNTLFGSLLFGDRISFFRDRGLYDHSRNGYFLRVFHGFAHLVGLRPEMVLTASSPDEQARLFEENIAPFFENRFIKMIGKLPVTLFGLGIPPQQYAELTRELSEGKTIIDIYLERVRKLACDFPIRENYFAWQAFARRYDIANRIALPDYLKADKFEKLRSEIGKLTTVVGSVSDLIRSSPPGSFNRFVFLDAQDWMNAEQLTDLWTAIASNGGSGSRIIFRTAGSGSPIETALPPALRARFHYERERSTELFNQDRASIYGGFHLYTLK